MPLGGLLFEYLKKENADMSTINNIITNIYKLFDLGFFIFVILLAIFYYIVFFTLKK
ncbi:protein of unknown function [Clostridium beijerinckii]|nr:protein of unknown function [Clostridium beijerinckii]